MAQLSKETSSMALASPSQLPAITNFYPIKWNSRKPARRAKMRRMNRKGQWSTWKLVDGRKYSNGKAYKADPKFSRDLMFGF